MGVGVSRRTDIPGLFGRWFRRRLEEGFAEYIPAGPPRRVRRSIRPENVTHFCFWSRWPRPFFPVLEQVLAVGYPVLWNVTLTGLGQTEIEPHAPPTQRGLEALLDLSRIVPPSAIQWRYDPIFVSERFSVDRHLVTFTKLAEQLAGRVDRVAVSFVHEYGRRVKPDLQAYQRQTGDRYDALSMSGRIELVCQLREIADGIGIPLTLCCSPELREAVGCPASGCNSFTWARRVYPVLDRHRRLKTRPTRPDCACSEEIDIGCYDTCVFGCRYSYGSCNRARALANFRRHDPQAPCLIP